MFPLPEVSEQLLALVHKHLANRPDALWFLRTYSDYCHAIDDIIDVPALRADNEFIGRVLDMALELFSSDFYAARRAKLYAIVKNVQNTYMDSVRWESSDENWQRTVSDVLRCCAHDMTATVVELVVTEQTGDFQAGYNAKREVSLLCRMNSWTQHHDDEGKAI